MKDAEAPTSMDVLCPMHVLLDASGVILRTGPTLMKVLADHAPVGKSFFSLFDIRRPRNVACGQDLADLEGQKLRLRAKLPPLLDLKGVLVRDMSGSASQDRYVLNLSFGISVVRAVQEYELTAVDFAATDLAVEMLYLVEAKSAAMDASKELNRKLQTARELAEEQALTDPLTGLKNRRALDAALSGLIWSHEPFVLMHLDLDHFKRVNDTMGHAAGDYVLTRVAEILRNETRANDIVARLGGDEFVAVLRGTAELGIIEQIAARIIARISQPVCFAGKRFEISASIGSTVSTDYAMPDAEAMALDADLALYAAKREGRAMHCFFSKGMRTGEPARAGETNVPREA